MKKAFVTGASRGIGRGIALKLAQDGYDIAFTYYSELDDAESLAQTIKSLGRKAFFYQASLEKPHVAEEVTKQAIMDLGGIDVLICNAGKTIHTSIQTLDSETMDFLYTLNFKSYVLATKVATNHMIETKTKGRIVYISSTRSMRAYKNDAIYGSLKAALNRIVESLAIELSEFDITINSVAPGATEVRNLDQKDDLKKGHFGNIIPLGRKGTPEDVANLVSFIVSDQASYITGVTIKVDGGLILYGPNEKENGGFY